VTIYASEKGYGKMIEAKQVTLEYELTNARRLQILLNFNLTVSAGEVIAIIGPSGCGKTSLLNALAGLIPIADGSITVAGSNPRLALEQRSVSYVFQRPVLFPWRTVLQNVLLPAELNGRKDTSQINNWPEKAGQLLELVGIDEKFWNELPSSLSGGMQARVALARAYLTSPEVLLMDEPFASLDQINREKMNLELLRMRQLFGSTIIFVTHSIEEAVFVSDRVVVLSHLPAKVDQIVEVGLTQDRNLSLRDSSDFIAVTKILREALGGVYNNDN